MSKNFGEVEAGPDAAIEQRVRDAGPELLEALQELVATKELHDQLEVLKPFDPAREEEYRRRRVAAWGAARTAIAKATSAANRLAP